jgi:hypothetical protein
MGYETWHELEVYKADVIKDNLPILGEKCNDEIKQQFAEEITEDSGGYIFEEWEKWYDCIFDMCEFSKKYPEYIFKVHGEGEEAANDQWDAYFWNGKHQICNAIITYPPFDPIELSVFVNEADENKTPQV